MPTPRFTRTREDFICGHCGGAVVGNGYTNHCPTCLWSRHVDVFPGDRLARCSGMMEPVAIELCGDGRTITHRCVACGHEKRNKAAPDDSFEALLTLTQRAS